MPGCGVANAAGFRNSSPPSSMNGSTPGTRSGRRVLREAPPPGVLMTATRSAAALFQTLPRAVHVDDVVAGDQHRDRQAAARVEDRADVPAAEQRLVPAPALDRYLRPRPIGSEYSALRLKVWRTSKLL